MITLIDNALLFQFPEIHDDAMCWVRFHRTLRIPDDGRDYPLPPGLGCFPLADVSDHADAAPDAWCEHPGVMLPMYQAEAMWIGFASRYPMAIKIATGGIDAITGERFREALSPARQDYLVLPDQPWLDGFCVDEGRVRQFIAMPLGDGYTAEEQLTGDARNGGLQIVVRPMKADAYAAWSASPSAVALPSDCVSCAIDPLEAMGLAPGGAMRQQIFTDPFEFNVWHESACQSCFAHVLNSAQFHAVTGTVPPIRPPSAEQYSEAGLPWFEYYQAERDALEGAGALAGMDSIATKMSQGGDGALHDNVPVSPLIVKTLVAGELAGKTP